MTHISNYKKKIYVICPFPQGEAAGQRLKYEQYFKDWEKTGFEITVSCFMDSSLWNIVYKKGNFFAKTLGVIRGLHRRFIDLFRVHNYDIVYVFMWGTPLGSSLYERVLRFLSKSLIYDIEDNVMKQQVNSLNPITRLLRGNGKTKFLLKTADHVITSSPFLNDYALGLNSKKAATYISSSIDVSRFVPSNNYLNTKLPVLGWTGTFSSKEYLDLISPSLLKLAKKANFKLRVIGNFDYTLAGIETETIQWTKEHEVRDLQGIDIGLYPLPQNEWVLGKSGLKALQYMAFGLPTVATNIGTTPRIIQDMDNGILVSSEDEWVDSLERLINDPSLRKKLGEKARQTVVNKYSTNVISSQYLNILDSLMEK